MKKLHLLVLISIAFACNESKTNSLQQKNTPILQAMEKVRIAKDSNELPLEIRKEYLFEGYEQLEKFNQENRSQL